VLIHCFARTSLNIKGKHMKLNDSETGLIKSTYWHHTWIFVERSKSWACKINIHIKKAIRSFDEGSEKTYYPLLCLIFQFQFKLSSNRARSKAPYASIMWIYLQTTLHKLTAAFVVIYGKIQPDIETMVG